MKDKINIAELLKDCPKGMELDCTIYNGKVCFEGIDDRNPACPIIKISVNLVHIERLDAWGQYSTRDYSKCVIFPKGKTTWEGFVPPCRFKDGDIIADNHKNIAIYKGKMWYNCNLADFYCGYRNYDNRFLEKPKKDGHFGSIEELHLATEEEKQKLFDVIKENGYKWNAETKTLDKLSKFKAGDVLVSENGNIVLLSHIDNENIVHYHCIIPTYGSFRIEENTSIGVGRYYDCVLANEQQRQRMYDKIKCSGYKYNQQLNKLEKLNEPKFKDGDILYIRTANTWICIYKEGGEKENVYYKYVATSSVTFVHDNSPLCIREHVKEIRLATKDEQQKLFDAIKENGYRWNFQAKRLEELITPIFKKGDKIRVRNGVSEPRIIDDVCDTFYTLVPIGTIDFTEQNRWELVPDKLIKPNFRVGDTIQDVDGYKVEITKVDIDGEYYEYLSIIAKGIGSIPFKYQNEWNLVFNKSVEPKFKVGDRIKQIGSPRCYIIKTIEFDRYVLNNNQFIRFVDEHIYELVPNKFDITTLKPFESRVLVRDSNYGIWRVSFWGCLINSEHGFNYDTIRGCYKQCVPYEQNEHLLGKTDDCDEYYKTWK
jgi:hypothetical protein